MRMVELPDVADDSAGRDDLSLRRLDDILQMPAIEQRTIGKVADQEVTPSGRVIVEACLIELAIKWHIHVVAGVACEVGP